MISACICLSHLCTNLFVSLRVCVKRERERERERAYFKMHLGVNCNGRAFCSRPHGAAVTNESAASRIYSTLIKLAFVPAAEYQLIRPALSSQPQTHKKHAHTPATSHPARFGGPIPPPPHPSMT